MKTTTIALIALLTLAVAGAATAGGTQFNVADNVGRNVITFTSEAPLEDIVGTTNQITGSLEFDPANPEKGGRGQIKVPVASLDTGIPLRDEHLQGGVWLDARNYPEIIIEIIGLESVKTVSQGDGHKTFDVKASGLFTLKGQTRELTLDARVAYLAESDQTRALMPGDLLAVRTSFEVPLAAHGVTGPPGKGIVGSKVGETVTVDVSFRASNAAE